MKKKLFMVLGIALGLSLTAAKVNGELTPPEVAAQQLAAKFEEQYPFPVNASPDLSKILLKSRIGSRFILAFMDRTGRVEQFEDSTQTQLAITWNPSGTGVAWLEPVKAGCGFQLRFFNLSLKQKIVFNELQVNTAASPLRFSPSGRFVALVAGSKLAVLDLQKRNAQVQNWFEGVSGASDFIWVSDDEILTSPNDGSGALHVVSYSTTKRIPVFGQDAQIRNLSWSKFNNTLLGSVRQPHEEYDSIFAFKNISTQSKDAINAELVSKEKVANAIRPQWIGTSNDFVYTAQKDDVQQLKIHRGTNNHTQTLDTILGEIDVFGFLDQKILILRSAADSRPTLGMLDITSKNSNSRPSFSALENSGQHKNLGGKGPSLATIQSKDNSPVYVQHWIGARVKGRPASAAVWIHGGPNLRESVKWNAETQELISRGIDFVQVNYRGSTGYGRKFEMSGSDGTRLNDIEATFNYLQREYKIQPSRIILMGSSYGGYLAARYAKERPAGLRALFLLSPGSFNRQTESFDKQTPLEKAKASFPMIVYQGLQDCVITPSSGVKILDDLFGAGVTNWPGNRLTVFPDEGHHFHRTSSRSLVWSRVLEEMNHE